MERKPIHRETLSETPYGPECDDHAIYLSPRKSGRNTPAKFKHAYGDLVHRGLRAGSNTGVVDDVGVQRTHNTLRGRCNSHQYRGAKNDPFGYYIYKIIEIESENWFFSQEVYKQVVRLTLFNFMHNVLASNSSNVCNLPVVLRGGGFAGRAGFRTHGLRFPPVV